MVRMVSVSIRVGLCQPTARFYITVTILLVASIVSSIFFGASAFVNATDEK